MSEGDRAKWTGPILIALASLAMVCWTWRTWPDVVVDFGMQLYMAWQLAAGKALYMDLAHFKGPFSQYFNSWCFRLFGASITTLVVCNLAITGVLIAMLYGLLRQMAGRLGATIGCLTFVLLFGFGQLVKTGNYNFVCPYSHEVTHGITLGVASLYCLLKYGKRQQWAWLAASGGLLGLAFLTDAHIFLSAAAAVVTVFAMVLWIQRRWRKELLVFVGSGLVPPLTALLLLRIQMPMAVAWTGLLGSWPYSFRSDVLQFPLYRVGMGVNDIPGNLLTMLGWTGLYALVIAAAAGLAFALRRWKEQQWLISGVLLIVVAGIFVWGLGVLIAVARPFPLIVLAIAAFTFVRFVRNRPSTVEQCSPLIARMGFAVLALGLLWKMLLNARIEHYGFALAMPAGVLAAVLLVDWIPDWIGRRGGLVSVSRGVLLGVWIGTMGWFLLAMNQRLEPKVYPVGVGSDAILSDDRGIVVADVVKALAEVPEPKTLVAVPQGVMLNYLSRCPNPTPYTNFTPMDLAFFPQEQVLASLQANPPDYVAIVASDMSAFGAKTFGVNYAQDIAAWVQKEYQVQGAFAPSAQPSPGQLRIYLLKRRGR